LTQRQKPPPLPRKPIEILSKIQKELIDSNNPKQTKNHIMAQDIFDCPMKISNIIVILFASLMVLATAVDYQHNNHPEYTEPVRRSIPKMKPISQAPTVSANHNQPRKLYSNDGHWSSTASGTHSGKTASNSWEDQNGGVFPQRNEDFPEPKRSQKLPSIQKPPPRSAIPVISAQQPSLQWLVSGNWVENNHYYSSNVVYGFPSYVVDKELGSQVHLTYEEGKECWLVFNLRKAYQMAGVVSLQSSTCRGFFF